MYPEDKGVASHARSKDRCFGQGESKSHKGCSSGGHSHTIPSARPHPGPRPHTWITPVSVLEPRVRAVALAQAASHRHKLHVSQGQGSMHRVFVPYVH